MLEIAPTAIIAIDQNHAIRLCSKGAAKLFGYAAQETIGLPMTLLFSDEAAQKGAAPLAPPRRRELARRYGPTSSSACAAATSRAAPNRARSSRWKANATSWPTHWATAAKARSPS